MSERVVNWLVYTCLIGMIPVAARLLVYKIAVSGVEPLAVSDLVAFGLVLHSANINEINKLKDANENWKTIQSGFSIMFLVMYAVILFTTILNDKRIDQNALMHATIFMSLISFVLSATVYQRTKVEKGTGK